MKKKIDERIRILIENCVKTNHRSLFLIIGDRGLYQVSPPQCSPTVSLDREPAHIDVEDSRAGSSSSPLVLQKRAGNVFVQEKARQADQKARVERKPGQGRDRLNRAIYELKRHPILLLQGLTPDLGSDFRHVRAARLREHHSKCAL